MIRRHPRLDQSLYSIAAATTPTNASAMPGAALTPAPLVVEAEAEDTAFPAVLLPDAALVTLALLAPVADCAAPL